MEPFEKKIQEYTESVQKKCVRESAVLETIRGSEDAFIRQEDRLLTYAEFLYQQARYIGKRWWILQGLVLASLLFLLNDAGRDLCPENTGSRCFSFCSPGHSGTVEEPQDFCDGDRGDVLLFPATDLFCTDSAAWHGRSAAADPVLCGGGMDGAAFPGDVYHQLCSSVQYFLLHLLPGTMQPKSGDGIRGGDHLSGVGGGLDDGPGAGPGL